MNTFTTGNTMQHAHVEHSTTTRIESVWDDSNNWIDTNDTNHLPNPSEYRSEVAVMFDTLCSIIDSWVHCPNTEYLLGMARNELIRNGRSDFYHEVIKELVKLYNAPQGGE